MATITTTHTDPDEKAAQEGYDRTVVVIRDKGNEIGSSVLQVRFFQSVTDFALGINSSDIATGAASLGSTSPVAALGGSSSASTPPTGVVDHFKLGQDLTTILAGVGHADPNVGLAFIRSLLQEAITMQTVGQPDKAKKLLAGLAFVANRVQHGDIEDDGTLKVFAAFTAMKSERDAAITAKNTAEAKVTTLETKVSDLQTKLDTVKTKWTALKAKLTAGQDGDKFKRGTEFPATDMNDLTNTINS